MNNCVAVETSPQLPFDTIRNIDPAPLIERGRNWTQWAGPLISVLILAAVAYQLRRLDYHSLPAMLPRTPGFWMALIAYYLVGPASEWIIFRRLWSLPVDGFAALLRKLVSNEILLGYLGELYFYAWARRNAHITAAPFGAIKDVTILSALTGNVATLLIVLLAAPFLGALHLGVDNGTVIASALVIIGSSTAAMLLRKRLFTLPRRELWFVTGAHMARIVAAAVLAAVMWHILLPEVPLSWWLILAAARQLLSRLPLLPNKDVLFAGLAVFMVGSDQQIVAAMTLMATLILGAHLLVGGVLGLSALIHEGRAR